MANGDREWEMWWREPVGRTNGERRPDVEREPRGDGDGDKLHSPAVNGDRDGGRVEVAGMGTGGMFPAPLPLLVSVSVPNRIPVSIFV